MGHAHSKEKGMGTDEDVFEYGYEYSYSYNPSNPLRSSYSFTASSTSSTFTHQPSHTRTPSRPISPSFWCHERPASPSPSSTHYSQYLSPITPSSCGYPSSPISPTFGVSIDSHPARQLPTSPNLEAPPMRIGYPYYEEVAREAELRMSGEKKRRKRNLLRGSFSSARS